MDRFSKGLTPDEVLARQVIGLAMEVHHTLGSGFDESIYRGALVIKLREAQLELEVHPVLPVFYRGEEVGVFQPDIIVQGKLILELMAVDGPIIPDSGRLVSYLSAAQINHGLLINFEAESLQFKNKTRTSSIDLPPVNPPNLSS